MCIVNFMSFKIYIFYNKLIIKKCKSNELINYIHKKNVNNLPYFFKGDELTKCIDSNTLLINY